MPSAEKLAMTLRELKAFCGEEGEWLLLFYVLTEFFSLFPRIECQGNGDGAVGDEAAEIFAERRIAEEVLAGLGGDHEEGMEEKNAE